MVDMSPKSWESKAEAVGTAQLLRGLRISCPATHNRFHRHKTHTNLRHQEHKLMTHISPRFPTTRSSGNMIRKLTKTWIVAKIVIAKKRPRYASATKPPRKGVRYTAPTKFDTILADSGLLKCISVVKYRTKLRCNPKVANLSHSSVPAMTHHSAPQHNIAKGPAQYRKRPSTILKESSNKNRQITD
jgi:hypothetical protein